ncbi:MAG: hypothetical protein ABI594_14420 [Ginsengibacter sp.]
MCKRNLILPILAFIFLYTFNGCNSERTHISLPSKDYDLNNPSKLILGSELAEISGINFYPRDSSVFAISDETGYLYKIHLNKKFLIEKWMFNEKHDFEDVIQLDNSFYVLESNGNIEKLDFAPKIEQDKGRDTVFNRRTIFPASNVSKNEFESLYYDDEYKGIVMICKDCEEDGFHVTTAWLYDPVADTYTKSIYKIQLDIIAKQIGRDSIKFRPSAAAVNPITKDVWVISSTDELIVVLDRKGNMKDVYTLNPIIFSKPEGITFTPSGVLMVSNEAVDKYGSASLLIFKPKK